MLKQLRRDQMTALFVNLPLRLIGMEACGRAHHWARILQGFGYTVRLMSPQFVKPYVKNNKNDVADAEAISRAVTISKRGGRGTGQQGCAKGLGPAGPRVRVSTKLCCAAVDLCRIALNVKCSCSDHRF